MRYPILLHCESGRKALLEDERVMTYWTRWANIWVEVDSPLLSYKPNGMRL